MATDQGIAFKIGQHDEEKPLGEVRHMAYLVQAQFSNRNGKLAPLAFFLFGRTKIGVEF